MAIFSSRIVAGAQDFLVVAFGEHDLLWIGLRLENHGARDLVRFAQTRSSCSRYSSRLTGSCATPVSIAAFATADASHTSTRGSNGFGIR